MYSADDPWSDSIPLPDPDDEDRVEYWIAHEQPEREFDIGTWLCDCRGCRLALTAEARRSPSRVLCIKTGADRIVLRAALLDETLRSGQPIEALLYVPGDYVREVFVPVNGWLPRDEDWWSLTRAEEQEVTRSGGRRPSRR